MSTSTNVPHSIPNSSILPLGWNLADLQQRLGNVPLERIRLHPPPGYATQDDVVKLATSENRLYELEYGTLVEKPMGWYESIIATLISFKIRLYLQDHDLGQVLGADGSVEILAGVIKIPDVSFISWARFPQTKIPRRPIPALIPDLAIEVLSESNTPQEMHAKLARYFEAGVKLVWFIDPQPRTATAFISPTDSQTIDETGELDGGEVLPGFKLSIQWLFQEADRQA